MPVPLLHLELTTHITICKVKHKAVGISFYFSIIFFSISCMMSSCFYACLCEFAVSWSCSPSFSPSVGEMVVEDAAVLQCNITGLTSVS